MAFAIVVFHKLIELYLLLDVTTLQYMFSTCICLWSVKCAQAVMHDCPVHTAGGVNAILHHQLFSSNSMEFDLCCY